MSYVEELFSLKDKNAIVTGAASGLGQQCAQVLLAKAGARVALVDKNADGLQHTAQLIKEFGGESISITCDVRIQPTASPRPLRRRSPRSVRYRYWSIVQELPVGRICWRSPKRIGMTLWTPTSREAG